MEKTKKFKVFGQEKYEYDIVVEETENGMLYSLYYSNSKEWTFGGEFICSVLDNDFELKLSKKIGKSIDYSTLVELRILFNFISKHDKHMSEEFEVIAVPQKPFLV